MVAMPGKGKAPRVAQASELDTVFERRVGYDTALRTGQKDIVVNGWKVGTAHARCINDAVIRPDTERAVLDGGPFKEIFLEGRLVIGHQLSLELNVVHEHMINAPENVFFRVQARRLDQFHKTDRCSPGAGGDAARGVGLFVEDIRLKAFISEKSVKIGACCAGPGNGHFQTLFPPFERAVLLSCWLGSSIPKNEKIITKARKDENTKEVMVFTV
jgi:hypothetical protein